MVNQAMTGKAGQVRDARENRLTLIVKHRFPTVR